jgi:hypothetical protein
VTNDSIVWSSSKASVVIEASTGYDTLCTFKGIAADTALIYAASKANSDIKDSCVVIVSDRFIYIETDTVTATGKIELSIMIPAGVTFTSSSFELQLPKGFTLTNEGDGYRTSLVNEANVVADLAITYINDSTFTFNITPKITPSSNIILSSVAPVKIMDIYYTIYDDALEGNNDIYEARFNDITVNLNDSKVIKEEYTVKIRVFKDPTGNEFIKDGQNAYAYIINNRLFVNSDKAETVYVYSQNGSLIYLKDKTEGLAFFDINTQEKILIIKGSSGWSGKAVNR